MSHNHKNMKSSRRTQKGSFKPDVVWFIWSRYVDQMFTVGETITRYVTKNTSGGVREKFHSKKKFLIGLKFYVVSSVFFF